MRRLLIAIFAAFMLLGTRAATACFIADNAFSVATTNVLDKLIALVNGYIKRVGAAVSIEELEALYAGLEQDMASFAKDNAGEIAKFDADLTGKAKEKYEAELSKAIKSFKSALEKRAMEFLGE